MFYFCFALIPTSALLQNFSVFVTTYAQDDYQGKVHAMSRGKTTTKKTKAFPVTEEIKSDAVEIFPLKGKNVIDIEEREDIITTDNKLIADPLLSPDAIVGPDTTEAEGEEVGLDEEELDPFGDKWEV